MNVKMILTNRFDPDVRVLKEARYIREKGHDIEILCWDRENEYKEKETEIIDSIKIKRFYPYAKYGTGLKQLFPMFRFIRQVRKYLKNQPVDILHAHDLDGSVVCYFSGKKAFRIFDMHEYYLGHKNSGWKKSIIRWILNRLHYAFDGIIYVNEEQIKEMSDENKKKLVYLPNYPEKADYPPLEKIPHERLNLSYIGAVRQFDQLKRVFDATKDLPFTVSIHGNGVDYEKLKEIESNYHNVSVTGGYHYDQINSLYQQADLLLVVYDPKNKNAMNAWPVKFFEAIITKTPMIVTTGSIVEAFVKEHDIGYVVNTESTEAIHSFLEDLSNNPKELMMKKENLGRIRYRYSWDEVVKNLDRWYDEN